MAVINTLADVTRVHAQQRGDVSALFCADDGREWTYAELDTQANVVANALLEAGVSVNRSRISTKIPLSTLSSCLAAPRLTRYRSR